MASSVHNIKFSIHCKEATQLMVMNEFEKLSFLQKITLHLHLRICKACALFKKQSRELNELIKKNDMAEHISLSAEKKADMTHSLNQLMQ